MPVWERNSISNAISTQGNSAENEVLHNEVTGGELEYLAPDLTVVDGLITVHTDSDDLVRVQLVIAHELVTSADLASGTPSENDPMLWYSWYTSRGPAFFRTRTKRRVPREHKLWIQTVKEQGATSTAIHVGYQFLIVPVF